MAQVSSNMHLAKHQPTGSISPAFLLGGLTALYFLLGRWTFARLQGVYDEVSLVEQPRVWVVGAIFVLGCLIFSELRLRNLTRLRAIDGLIIVWLTYMLAAAWWAPDAELANEKAVEVALLLAVAVAVALTRSDATQSHMMLGFWYALVIMGATMGLVALAMSTGGRVFTPTGGPNIFGRNMGLVGLGALLLASRNVGMLRWMLYFVVLMSAMWVVMCGSRGALLASGVAAMVLLFTARSRISTRVLASIGFGIAGFIAFTYTELGRNALQVFRHRILHLTMEDQYTAGREYLFTDAWYLGIERPVFGWGLSGFRANSWTYPHNLFLEAFTDGGLVGFILLVAIVGVWWRCIRRRTGVAGTNVAAVALVLTSASFSGSFYDSRGVFLLMATSIEPLTWIISSRSRAAALSVGADARLAPPCPRPTLSG